MGRGTTPHLAMPYLYHTFLYQAIMYHACLHDLLLIWDVQKSVAHHIKMDQGWLDLRCRPKPSPNNCKKIPLQCLPYNCKPHPTFPNKTRQYQAIADHNSTQTYPTLPSHTIQYQVNISYRQPKYCNSTEYAAQYEVSCRPLAAN